METIRWISARSCVTAIGLCLLVACSHNDASNNDAAKDPGDRPVAQSAAPDANPSLEPNTAAVPSAGCHLIDTASVEKAMRHSVESVKVDATSCEFSFKTVATDLTVEFEPHDGAHNLDILRSTVGAASGAMNGAVGAASSAAPGIGRMAAGVVSANAPRGIAKLGDDQFASGPSPALFVGVRRGDTYVQISGAAMPDGVDPWAAATDLVRETFANQH